jgi:hypothetical protein
MTIAHPQTMNRKPKQAGSIWFWFQTHVRRAWRKVGRCIAHWVVIINTWDNLGGQTVVASSSSSSSSSLLGSVDNAVRTSSSDAVATEEEEPAVSNENRILIVADTQQVRSYLWFVHRLALETKQHKKEEKVLTTHTIYNVF